MGTDYGYEGVVRSSSAQQEHVVTRSYHKLLDIIIGTAERNQRRPEGIRSMVNILGCRVILDYRTVL